MTSEKQALHDPMGQQYPTQPQPHTTQMVHMVTDVPQDDLIRSRFSPKTMMVLGILQIITGVCAIALQIPITTIYLGVAGAGFWCGLLFIVTGVFGIKAGQKKTSGFVKVYLTLSVISSVFGLILFIMSIMNWFIGILHYWDGIAFTKMHESVSIVLTVLGLLAAIFGMVAAILGCCALCYCCSGKETQAMQYINTPNGPQLVPITGTTVVVQ